MEIPTLEWCGLAGCTHLFFQLASLGLCQDRIEQAQPH
jgi:hypothetical protein